MSILIAGGAGFVGVNLVRVLASMKQVLLVYDNESRGNRELLPNSSNIHFRKVDLNDIATLRSLVKRDQQNYGDITEIWHLAANSDIPAGIADITVDLNNTFLSTVNLLRLAEEFKIVKFLFASSSAIYGDLKGAELREEIGPLLPISNYGAMKLASEALLSAAFEKFLKRLCIFRFPNVIGIPATHGVIFDFVNRLKSNPSELHVLGDGSQQKAYMHVDDLVEAMLFIRDEDTNPLSLFNIGPSDQGVTVRYIAEETARIFGSRPSIHFGEGNKGWIGDVPKFNYSTEKLKLLGWTPRLSSTEAVKKSVKQIVSQIAGERP
ncbi:NAD-dependent epimerase/dehydratase family protein [Rhizobiales bacterium TNE-4]|nr:NAD-dependent epimerase/dehydratase family protein [Rhizobiales bacterium TNE-4]MBV1827564.1 NAD-dependent epimerase/dehydratase family protein [Rhizobiales bacterium TNE-4]